MGSQQTLFAADTHASLSVMPGSEQARQTTAISGRKCIDLLKLSGRDGCLPRTLLATSQWASTLCYLTWKPRTTPHGYLLFQLAPSMPDTDVIESGLWPTPNVAGGGNSCELTPHGNHFLRPSGKKAHLGLDQAVRLWPTPSANQSNAASMEAVKREGERLHPQGRWTLATKVQESDNPDPSGSLNPTWVAWLMGFPTEWTALNPSETASSPRLLRP